MFLTTLALILKSRFGKRFVLEETIVAGGTPERHPELLHAVGEAVTDLRPGGLAQLDGRRIDVVARTGYIRCGERVVVVRVEGCRIAVELAPDPDSPS